MPALNHFNLVPSTLIDDRFEVLKVLGGGAMSLVVAARHLRLRQKVAIKLLRPEFLSHPDVAARFMREGHAAARLRNEHVVSVMDVGSLPSGVPFLVMEYLEGVDLAAHLAAEGPLPLERVIEYGLQVLEALAEAHRSGIVHRDLKPANLMLSTREDGSALVKVLDFGVSKLSGSEFTMEDFTAQSPMLGSPAYMAPEQIRDPSSVDGRADIWSMGMVLYELLTRRLPFSARNAVELVSAVCSPAPTPVSSLVALAPLEFVAVVARCLQKDRNLRFQSVQELASALRPFARSTACQLSVERITGMGASAPPRREWPAAQAEWRSPRESLMTDTRSGRRHHRLRVAALTAIAACAVGLGIAAAPHNSVAPALASRAPSLAPICASASVSVDSGTPSERRLAHEQAPPPLPQGDARIAAADEQSPLETAGMLDRRLSPRTPRGPEANINSTSSVSASSGANVLPENEAYPASEAGSTFAESPPSSYVYPRPRPLDRRNPYFRQRAGLPQR